MNNNENILPEMSLFKAGKYRHYKGAEYRVIDTATHSESEELLVVYRPLYGEAALWVRPFNMFFETLMVDGVLKKRFEFIEE